MGSPGRGLSPGRRTAALAAILGAAALAWLRLEAALDRPSPSSGLTFREAYMELDRPVFEASPAGGGTVELRPARRGFHTAPFLLPKPAGTVRIFVAGGSVAAKSDRWPDGGSWRSELERLSPGTRFEVLNAGHSAFDSLRDAAVARELSSYQPDYVVLFSGNNEFYDPPRLARPRLAFAAMKLRELAWFRRLQGAPPSEPGAFECRFERNLREAVRAVRKSGAAAVLCTLPNNLADYAPLASGEAASAFADGARLRATGMTARAALAFRRACDLDVDRMRCPPSRNDAIRRIAAEEGAVLADLERSFSEEADPLPGLGEFFDGVHWRDEYNPFIAAVITRSIGDWKPREARRWELRAAKVRISPASAELHEKQVLYHLLFNVLAGDCEPARRDASKARVAAALAALERISPGALARLDEGPDSFSSWAKESERARWEPGSGAGEDVARRWNLLRLYAGRAGARPAESCPAVEAGW